MAQYMCSPLQYNLILIRRTIINIIHTMNKTMLLSSSIREFLQSKKNQARALMNELQLKPAKQKSKTALQIEGLEQMAQGLLKYMHAGLEQKLDIKNIVKKLEQKLKLQSPGVSILLGLAIRQQVAKNPIYEQLNKDATEALNASKSILYDSDDEQFQIDFSPDSSLSAISKSGSNLPDNFYSKQASVGIFTTDHTPQNEMDSSFLENDSLMLNFDEKKWTSDVIQHQNKEIMDYLCKLSYPTTELSYLCQKMKWLQPDFKDEKSKINDMLFSCLAQVHVRSLSQDICVMESECPGAISKKEARRIASLFLLRKIYHRFNDVWKIFKRCREENPSMQQPLTASNQEIFKKAHFNLVEASIFKEEEKFQAPKNLHTLKIEQYLEQLKSHKVEINLLQGKYNKRLSQVQFERGQQNGLNMWPVKATIYSDNELLEAEATESSKKIAEQKCCQKLLLKIYSKDIHRWEEFKSYKKSKGLN